MKVAVGAKMVGVARAAAGVQYIYHCERVKRASFGIGCVKGRRILSFVISKLQCGWTNLAEFFSLMGRWENILAKE